MVSSHVHVQPHHLCTPVSKCLGNLRTAGRGHVEAASSSEISTSDNDNTMRWLNLLTAAVLPFTALAAKKPSGDRFDDFRSKTLAAGTLKLDDALYGQLTKAPRDYSVAVLLTALETRFGCSLCQDFQPEWDLLSKSWLKGDKKAESRLLFGTLDFTDGKNTFQSVWPASYEYMPSFTDEEL